MMLLYRFLGKYLTIPRTEDISTTDIVGRILKVYGTASRESEAGDGDGNIKEILADGHTDGDGEQNGVDSMKIDSNSRLPIISNNNNALDQQSLEFHKTVLKDQKSNFLLTTTKLRLFSENIKVRTACKTILYCTFYYTTQRYSSLLYYSLLRLSNVHY